MKADAPSDESYTHAAWMLNCEPRALKAIAMIEAGPEGAFYETGEPVILFERHIFHRLTNGRFDSSHPHLSNETSGGYGLSSAQHAKLSAAVQLDRDAALKSCSWGLFQILGLNHQRAGFPILQHFVNGMYKDVDEHLRALVMFIRGGPLIQEALRDKAWFEFARLYNGPQHEKHNYAGRIEEAYNGLA